MKEHQGWKIGALAGADIRLKPGALLILVFFMLVSLPLMQLGNSNPPLVIVGAAAIGLLIILSVFLHEVAHLLVGKLFGVQAKEIALTLLGGHAVFTVPFRKPWHGAVVALAGPATNIALGGLFLLVTSGLGHGTGYEVASVLATMNFALAVFNLIPGLPLDGGAALQDLVWSITGSKSTGVRVAATAGQVIAIIGLVLAVVIPMSRRELPNYSLLFFILIAVFFLWQGGSQAKRNQKSLDWFAGLSIYEYLSPAYGLPHAALVSDADGALKNYPGAALVVFSSTNEPVAYVVPQAAQSVPHGLRGTTPISAVTAKLVPGAVVRADTPMLRLFQTAAQLGGSLPFFVVMDGTSLIGIVDANKVWANPN